MNYLKANTAATVVFGPAAAIADGFTPVATLDLAAADSAEAMLHDGTVFTDIAGEGANQCMLTHLENGWYTLAMPAALLEEPGRLRICITDTSLCLPIWADFEVLAEETYDVLLAGASPAVAGVATTIWGKIEQLWRRFFQKATKTASQLKTYADNGTDVLTAQSVSDDGTTETQGPAA